MYDSTQIKQLRNESSTQYSETILTFKALVEAALHLSISLRGFQDVFHIQDEIQVVSINPDEKTNSTTLIQIFPGRPWSFILGEYSFKSPHCLVRLKAEEISTLSSSQR